MTLQEEKKGGESARVVCPRCKSENNWKDGTRKIKSGRKQLHICRDCGYRFSGSQILSYSESKDMCQVCDTTEGSKNLAVATRSNRAKFGLPGMFSPL